MGVYNRSEVKNVLKRAQALKIPLEQHIELSKRSCDVHLDSTSITTGFVGFPFWGGHYDPTRFIAHGIKDLAPSYLHGTWADFLSPALARLELDLSLNSRQDSLLTGGVRAPEKERFRVGFSVTFKFDTGGGK